MNSEQKIGMALSGGGVRGIAHLGVLQALNENHIFPTQFSGSSAGAIVGALYCSGMAPEEIVDVILKTNYFKFMRPAISWTGILSMDLVEQLFIKYFPENSFSSLKIPLSIAATDLKKAKVVYFSRGPLIKPLLASSCIPGMFDPILIEDNYYIDGGVLNNLPIEPLEGVCDVVIGVNCNQLPVESNIRNIKRLIERTVIMTMNYNVYSRKDKCDFFIEPPGLAKYAVFDVKKAPEIFKKGYEYTLAYMDKNPELLTIANVK